MDLSGDTPSNPLKRVGCGGGGGCWSVSGKAVAATQICDMFSLAAKPIAFGTVFITWIDG